MSLIEVLVRDHAQSRVVPLTLNGRRVVLPVGKPALVPEEFISAMRDARIDFEIINAPEEDDEFLTVLDKSARLVLEAAKTMSRLQLETLLDAERAGKARKTVIEAIERITS